MQLTLLSTEDIRRALPMGETIEVTKKAFADLSAGRAHVPQRMSIDVKPAGGTLLVKPAHIADTGLGTKLVSVFPGNTTQGKPVINGIMILIDPATGEPTALCDGGFLTAWRTGAASGAATDLLARDDASSAALIGCGVQARTQLLAICTARKLEEVRVYARDAASRDRFVEEMQPCFAATLTAAASSDLAVRGADIVCTATTSGTPVFEGKLLESGSHVNGVGSFTASTREIDAFAVGNASVFVDSRGAALVEAGDLLMAQKARRTDPEDWVELGEVAGGLRPGRRSEHEITLFKSVGVAAQDVATFAAALDNARRLSLGASIEL